MDPEHLLVLCQLAQAASDSNIWDNQEDEDLKENVTMVLDSLSQDLGYNGWKEAMEEIPKDLG